MIDKALKCDILVSVAIKKVSSRCRDPMTTFLRTAAPDTEEKSHDRIAEFWNFKSITKDPKILWGPNHFRWCHYRSMITARLLLLVLLLGAQSFRYLPREIFRNRQRRRTRSNNSTRLGLTIIVTISEHFNKLPKS